MATSPKKEEYPETPGSPDSDKQEFGPHRAPRGPHKAGDKKKKPEKRGRIPGGGDTVYRPGKGSGGGGGDTDQPDQQPQPVSKKVKPKPKKTKTRKFKFQVKSETYKMGR